MGLFLRSLNNLLSSLLHLGLLSFLGRFLFSFLFGFLVCFLLFFIFLFPLRFVFDLLPPGSLPVESLLLDFGGSFFDPFFELRVPLVTAEILSVWIKSSLGILGIPFIFRHNERFLLILLG